jgi:dihydroorotate dehydrogenase (fumarate)
MVDAGADAVELNLYALPSDPARSAADVEAGYLDVVREVRAAVRVPLAVKLSPYFSSLSHFAAALAAEGVNGLVLFNRFYSPDLDLESLTVQPRLELSRASELRLPLRWLAVLRPQLPSVSLAATSGVGSYEDVAKALLVGADVACMTSAVLREGPSHVAAVLAGLSTWLEENEYDSVDQMRGSVSTATSADPEAFERANYVKVLSSYAPSPVL